MAKKGRSNSTGEAAIGPNEPQEPNTQRHNQDLFNDLPKRPENDPAPDETEVVTQALKPYQFKAKLIFNIGNREIGPIGKISTPKSANATQVLSAEVLYTTCRVTHHVLPNWTSSVRFEIKLIKISPARIPGAGDKSKVVHEWTFHINSDDLTMHDHTIHHLPKIMGPTKLESERKYVKYNIGRPNFDQKAIETRKYGGLSYITFKFNASCCHTRSILIDTPAYMPVEYIRMHEDLREIFTRPEAVSSSQGEDEVLRAAAGVSTAAPGRHDRPPISWGFRGTSTSQQHKEANSQPADAANEEGGQTYTTDDTDVGHQDWDSDKKPKIIIPEKWVDVQMYVVSSNQPGLWSTWYNRYDKAVALELAHPPIEAWFRESKSHKSVIIRGKLPKPDHRPEVFVPVQYTFRNAAQYFVINGLSILLSEEYEMKLCKESAPMECQLRLLTMSAGVNDRAYIGLLRLPERFPYRFSSDDRFDVVFHKGDKNREFKWTAKVLDQPYVYANSTDITLVVYRHFDPKEIGWNTGNPESVFDLRTLKFDKAHKVITDYCYTGPANIVSVSPVRSDRPLKVQLAAVKVLNPAHEGEDKYEEFHNDKWEQLLVGQDLRSKEIKIDIFDGLNFRAKLREWKMKLNKGEVSALENMTQTPFGLALTLGCFGSGKTFLNVLVAMLCVSKQKTVKVVCTNNEAADNITLKLVDEFQRLEDMGINLTKKKVVRYYAPASETRYIDHKNTQSLAKEENLDKQRWTSCELQSLLHYDQVAYKMVKESHDRLGPVQDRRYKLTQHSMGTMLITAAEHFAATQDASKLRKQDDVPAETSGAESDSEGANGSDEEEMSQPDYDSIADDDLQDQECEIPDLHKPHKYKDEIDQLTGEGETSHRDELLSQYIAYQWQIARDHHMSTEEQTELKTCIRSLMQEFLTNDICVLVTTITNSGSELIKNHHADHILIEEAFTASHGEILTVLAHARGTVSMSGDTEQLQHKNEDVRVNCMAKSTNLSEFDRWVKIGHPYAEMWEQYRTIPVLSDIISSIWYENRVVCKVDPSQRPNVGIATKFLEQHGIEHPIAFLNVQSESMRVGATQSKQNYKEIGFAIDLVEGLINSGIKPSDICFITGYVAQDALFAKTLAMYRDEKGADWAVGKVAHMTIDKSQGRQWSCVIWSICGEKAGFHSDPARCLVAVSRAADSIIIIGNWDSLWESDGQSDKRAVGTLRQIQLHFYNIDAYRIVNMENYEHPGFKNQEDVVHAPEMTDTPEDIDNEEQDRPPSQAETGVNDFPAGAWDNQVANEGEEAAITSGDDHFSDCASIHDGLKTAVRDDADADQEAALLENAEVLVEANLEMKKKVMDDEAAEKSRLENVYGGQEDAPAKQDELDNVESDAPAAEDDIDNGKPEASTTKGTSRHHQLVFTASRDDRSLAQTTDEEHADMCLTNPSIDLDERRDVAQAMYQSLAAQFRDTRSDEDWEAMQNFTSKYKPLLDMTSDSFVKLPAAETKETIEEKDVLPDETQLMTPKEPAVTDSRLSAAQHQKENPNLCFANRSYSSSVTSHLNVKRGDFLVIRDVDGDASHVEFYGNVLAHGWVPSDHLSKLSYDTADEPSTSRASETMTIVPVSKPKASSSKSKSKTPSSKLQSKPTSSKPKPKTAKELGIPDDLHPSQAKKPSPTPVDTSYAASDDLEEPEAPDSPVETFNDW